MKPIGTHTEEIAEEQDPMPTESDTESVLSSASVPPSSMSSSMTEASPSPAPVSATEAPAAPAGTDETQQPETGSGDNGEEANDEQNPSLVGSIVGAVGDAWDWITGQAGKVWNDIIGGPQ